MQRMTWRFGECTPDVEPQYPGTPWMQVNDGTVTVTFAGDASLYGGKYCQGKTCMSYLELTHKTLDLTIF